MTLSAARALVTGGGGFLGGAIVRGLLEANIPVRSFSRNDYPELRRLGVEQAAGDLADADAVRQAVRGCDLVFHVAAKAGFWGPDVEYVRANIQGTQNILDACLAQGVARLIFTSSPSVVGDAGQIEGGDESLPYPARYLAAYPRTKAEAERRVLGANGPRLATVALRPHLVWGPGDHHLVPRLLARARAGRLRRVGAGRNRVDVTYIDNAARAHLQAAARLQPGAACAGRAYFLSQGEPVVLWDFVNEIIGRAGVPPVTRGISAGLAHALGAVCERLWPWSSEPPMTRFLAAQLGSSHWFDISAARRDLGYEPWVDTAQGLDRLQAWLKAADAPAPRESPAPAARPMP